ncbi:GrdX family protein [Aminivibrio sp.]|jgi:hypothetical protein|uniref:GrdX family protein n=1 Tax=Aminivibrio sp. TaxID=1872489 RepID=UPI0016B4FCF2|nr:GrdX protein [Synergistaceae bacterium]
MSCRRLLVTNNPLLNNNIRCAEFVEGDSLNVLIRARDLVHSGWKLLSHPLYGNLRPHQHPYRSILLEYARQEKTQIPDIQSLDYMENALGVYSPEKSRIPSDDDMPEDVRDDFAFLDAELMKESLSRYGLWPREDLKNSH